MIWNGIIKRDGEEIGTFIANEEGLIINTEDPILLRLNKKLQEEGIEIIERHSDGENIEHKVKKINKFNGDNIAIWQLYFMREGYDFSKEEQSK